MHFGQRLSAAVLKKGPCCVGLDPHPELLPTALGDGDIVDRVLDWSVGVLDALKGVVPVVKPQSALYEQWGSRGVQALEETIRWARHKGFIVILDAKRGDIGSTAKAYVKATLVRSPRPDAVTLSPYLGPESLTPFREHIDDSDQGAFILVRTSNPGARSWQIGDMAYSIPISKYVAGWINHANRQYKGAFTPPALPDMGPFGAVIGATLDADEVAGWREYMPNTWFLAPGYGAQGATAEALGPFFRSDGLGALAVSARGVLFSPDRRPEGADWQARVRERALIFRAEMKGIMALASL